MEAKEFVKGYNRMCSNYYEYDDYSEECTGCPLNSNCNGMENLTEEEIAKVEKWIEEHPIITNRMKFKELFVNAPMLVISKYDTEHGDWWDEKYVEPKGK